MYARFLRYFSSRTPRTRRAMSGGIFLAVAALMSASIFATGPEATPEPRREKAWPVSLMTVQPAAAKPSLRVYGRVESSRIAHLRTRSRWPKWLRYTYGKVTGWKSVHF